MYEGASAMTWLLLAIAMLPYGQAMMTERFESQQSCQDRATWYRTLFGQAQEWFPSQMAGIQISFECREQP